MIRKLACGALLVLAAMTAGVSEAQISMQPLTSFGGLGTGWLPPSGFPSTTGSGDRIRSVAFNPVSGNLVYSVGDGLVTMNATSGAVISSMDGAGISGGTVSGGITRSLGTVAVMSDGVIYGSNLSANTSTTQYKVYRWANEGSVPTLHYSGDAGLPGARLGDNFASNGSDGSGLLAAGFSNSPSVSGNNSFATISTGTSPASSNPVTYTGGAAGDFRLGITFADADTVLGTQGGGTAAPMRRVSFTGSAGTLDGSTSLNVGIERGLLYFTAYDTPLLATQEWGTGTTTNTVRLYNASNLLTTGTLSFIQSANLVTGAPATNGNAIGDLAFGLVNGTPTIYALSTNNGIQAFSIVPEPTSLSLVFGAAGLGLAGLRRRRGLGRRG